MTPNGDPNDSDRATLREQVRSILDALCEGTGVSDADNDEFKIELTDSAFFARVVDSPPTVIFYREVASGMPCTSMVTRTINDHNVIHLLYRATWEYESIYLRADIPAAPLVAAQVQDILDSFDGEVECLSSKFVDWIE